MSSTQSSPRAPLPPLFGRERHLLGWQGYTVPLPAQWNPGKFSGKRENGDLRVDDENGVRLELRWETTKGNANVEKSIDNFLKQLEKTAKKEGAHFERADDAKVVAKSRKKKEQIVNFGWIGEAQSETPCGFGTAWFCPVCERVTFAHVVGQPNETPRKVARLAGEILNDLECHGEGGWDTWSAFDVQVDVPTEFDLARAQLLLNKIEIEWVRPRPVGLYGWGRRAERLKLTRFPVANVLLKDKDFEEWANWNVRFKSKHLAFGSPQETEFRGYQTLVYKGGAKQSQSRLMVWLFDKIMRRRTPPGELRVWHDTDANRVYAFENEVSHVNEHVPDDMLDSLVVN